MNSLELTWLISGCILGGLILLMFVAACLGAAEKPHEGLLGFGFTIAILSALWLFCLCMASPV